MVDGAAHVRGYSSLPFCSTPPNRPGGAQEFKSLRDQRTNDVLYTLTIVTTLFVSVSGYLRGSWGAALVVFVVRRDVSQTVVRDSTLLLFHFHQQVPLQFLTGVYGCVFVWI